MDKVTPTLQYTLEMQLLTTDGNFRQHLTIYGNTMKNWKKITMKDGAVCPNFIVTYLWNGTPRNVKQGWVCGIFWVQHKSSRNLTPFSGNFIKWIKLCRSIPRWRCLSKLHCHKSLKRGPQGKNVKGLDLLDLSMATIWYHSIVSTGHIAILQTNYVVQFFQLTIAPSRLWRSVWSVNHTLLSNGWPVHWPKFK